LILESRNHSTMTPNSESVWFNKAQCDDAEKAYYEMMSGVAKDQLAKKQIMNSLDSVDLNGEEDAILSVLFNVKPGAVDTDLDAMKDACMSIEMDGLTWVASQLVPFGYGIKKLQIMCTVEDNKVSIEELTEKVRAIEKSAVVLSITTHFSPGEEEAIATQLATLEKMKARLIKTSCEAGELEGIAIQLASLEKRKASLEKIKARQHIKNSFEAVDLAREEEAIATKFATLEMENKELRKVTEDLKKLVVSLSGRVSKLECGGTVPKVDSPVIVDDKDDDIDLFGSDDDDEEEDAEKARITAERLKEYHEKKAKKPVVIAKTSVLFDVKPWADDTDLDAMKDACVSIEMDGLTWGASKLVPVGYGIKKLQIMCTVEDDKVSIEELGEKMEAFEEFVQSVDVAAMNKI